MKKTKKIGLDLENFAFQFSDKNLVWTLTFVLNHKIPVWTWKYFGHLDFSEH